MRLTLSVCRVVVMASFCVNSILPTKRESHVRDSGGVTPKTANDLPFFLWESNGLKVFTGLS